MKIDLKNCNILVTGASRGIGAAIAKELGNSDARIAIHYNNNKESAEAVAKSIGNGSKIFKANLGNPYECEMLFNSVLEEFGHIDVIVNILWYYFIRYFCVCIYSGANYHTTL